jgi:hypothetical protein
MIGSCASSRTLSEGIARKVERVLDGGGARLLLQRSICRKEKPMIENRQLAVVEELLQKVKRKNALVHMQALRHCERTDIYLGQSDRHYHRGLSARFSLEIDVLMCYRGAGF